MLPHTHFVLDCFDRLSRTFAHGRSLSIYKVLGSIHHDENDAGGITNQVFTVQIPPETAAAAGARVLHTVWTGSKNIEFQSIGVTSGSAWRAQQQQLHQQRQEESSSSGVIAADIGGGEVGAEGQVTGAAPFVILQAAQLI